MKALVFLLPQNRKEVEKTEEWKQKRLLKAKADRAFGSHENLYSKYTPQIPAAAEREYARIVTAYVGIVKDVLDEDLPAFWNCIKKNGMRRYLGCGMIRLRI